LDKYNDIWFDEKMKKAKSKLRKQQEDIINKDKEPKSNSSLMLNYCREC
jgi:hypothetical protein